ncbi:MAG: peptide MFS transporter [Bacteroidia bacterium]
MSNNSTSHPKGLYILFMTEMWERFSYYGMRALFILFMTKALLFDKALASNIYGSYTGLVYLTPLLGGYISDKYWGNRRSILVGGIMMAIGQFVLFFSGSMISSSPLGENPTANLLMYAGLTFLIFGNGFFKPNISTMVGQLYPPADKRVDAAFTIFYMGINLGAFLAPLVCGFFGETGNPADFRWGFLAAGTGMVISIITFELLKNKYILSPDGKPLGMPKKSTNLPQVIVVDSDAGKAKSAVDIPKFDTPQLMMWLVILLGLFFTFKSLLDFDYFGALIFSMAIAVPGLIISDKSLTKIEKDRIWVIFILCFFVIFFWSAFEQAGASLTFFAEETTNRSILGWEMPASWFQSFNPVFIIVLAPLMAALWVKLGNNNREPSSPLKMSMGLLFLSLGYVVIALGVHGVAPGVKVSMMWLTSLYLLHTFGELCLSPIGLSMVSKLAPLRFSSLLMGTWFLANATANKFTGILSALYPPGPAEFQQAASKGINNLQEILNGSVTATADQMKILVDASIPHQWPVFLGMQITDLYSFFIIFVVMSAIASAVLFVIYKWLSKLMHGVN